MKRSFHKTLNHTIMTVPVAAMMLGASQSQAVTSIGVNFWGSYGSANDPHNGRVVSAPAFGVPAANWGTSYVPADPDPGTWTYDAYVQSGNFTAGPVTVDYTAQGNWFTGITTANSPSLVVGETDVLNGGIVGGGTFGPNGAPGFKVSLTNLAATFPNGYVVQAITATDGGTSFAPVTITDGTTTDTLNYGPLRTAGGYFPAGAKWAFGGMSSTFTSDTLTLSGPTDTPAIRSWLSGFVITDKLIITDTNPPDVAPPYGSSVTMNSGVIGIGTLSYQWRKGGVNIPDATGSTLTLSNVTFANSGDYDVVVTSSAFPGSPLTGPVRTVSVVTSNTGFWTGSVNNVWDTTTANWVTDDVPGTLAPTQAAKFNQAGLLKDVTLATTLSPASVTFSGASDYTLSGAGGIGGAGALTIEGPGKVTISTANSLTGSTTISGGTLEIAGAGSLGGGAYPGAFANGGAFIHSSSTNETLAGVISGPGTITKSGTGTLKLTGASTWTGLTTISGGSLEVQGKVADSPYEVVAGGTLKIGYSTGGGYANTELKLHGAGIAATTGLSLAGGTSYNVSGTVRLLDAPTTIRQYGEGLAGMGIFDINGTGLLSTTAASGSVIDANIQFVSRGYGMTATIESGANTATGDLIVNGPLNIVGGGFGLVKKGPGSLQLNATATPLNEGLRMDAGTVFLGAADAIGPVGDLTVAGGATLVLNGHNQSAKKLSGAGTIVNRSATVTTLTLSPGIDSADTVPDATFSGVIGGAGTNENTIALVKTGVNALTLSGANTYTGDTTVAAGKLTVNSAFFGDSADVILTTGATLELNTGVTDTVDELVIDGIAQAGGEWGPDGSGATHTSPLLTGSGKLFVTTGGVGSSGYVEWISGEPYNLSGVDASLTADPDHDGIPNAIEFVLGGNPASADDSALAPTMSLVTADVGNGSMAYFKFTFHRSEISAVITPVVKYNSNLSGTWVPAVDGSGGVKINPAAGNNVEVYIPRSLAQGGKLFARLSVTM